MCYRLVSNAIENCSVNGHLARLCLQTMAHISSNGEYWEPASKLATHVGASTRGVQKALASLVEAGDIEVVQRGGGRATTRYRLTAALRQSITSPNIKCPAQGGVEPDLDTPDSDEHRTQQVSTEDVSELHDSSHQLRTPDVSDTNHVHTNKEKIGNTDIPSTTAAADNRSAGQICWAEGRRILPLLGVPKSRAPSLIGKWLRQIGETDLTEILRIAEVKQPGNVVSWVEGSIRARGAHDRRRGVIMGPWGEVLEEA